MAGEIRAASPASGGDRNALAGIITADEFQQVVVDLFDDAANEHPWRCVEVPGFLVMARREEALIHSFGERIRDEADQLAPVLPPPGWLKGGAGTMIPIVLFSREPQVSDAPDSLPPRIVQNLGGRADGVIATNTWSLEHRDARIAWRGRPLPLRTHALVGEHRSIVSDYYREWLDAQSPKPPRWLSEGLSYVWLGLEVVDGSIVLPSWRVKEIRPNDAAARAATGRLTNLSYADSLSIPMETVFAYYRGDESRALDGKLRMSNILGWQSSLFVRWALEDESRRDAFWAFAREATTGAADEATFKKHFRLSYLELDTKLNELLLADDGNADRGRRD